MLIFIFNEFCARKMDQEVTLYYKSLISLQLRLLNLLLLKKKLLLKNKKKRRWWRRPINMDRKNYGYYFTIFQELKQDENLFFRVTRMNIGSFNNLCVLLNQYLIKSRSDINPEERLAITLRYALFICIIYLYKEEFYVK